MLTELKLLLLGKDPESGVLNMIEVHSETLLKQAVGVVHEMEPAASKRVHFAGLEPGASSHQLLPKFEGMLLPPAGLALNAELVGILHAHAAIPGKPESDKQMLERLLEEVRQFRATQAAAPKREPVKHEAAVAMTGTGSGGTGTPPAPTT